MQNTIEKIEQEKLIVIVRGVPSEKLLKVAEALYDGGVRLMECTYDATGKTPDEENAANIKMLAEHFEGKMLVGAGTVLTEKQVELTKAAGGKFIISPDANEKIIKKTKELKMVSIPGALTPTEIVAAHNAGADFVKLFPIVSLGVQYVKAITAPISHIKLLAVGGVDETNMESYLAAGVRGFGLGSNIVSKKAVAENDFESIKKLAEACVAKLK